MNYLAVIFHAVAAMTGFLAVFILLFVNKEQRHATNLLSIALFGIAITNLNLFLFYSGYILYFSWFYKISSPINMLAAPAVFIYVRSLLNGELKFRKYDWLFLIPAVVHAVDLLPFYFMPATEKIKLLKEYIAVPANRMKPGPEGNIPQLIIQIFRVIWSVLLFSLSFRRVALFRRNTDKKTVEENRILLNWLSFFTGLFTVIMAVMLVLYALTPYSPLTIPMAEYSFGLAMLILIVQLFLQPSVLYGIYAPIGKLNIKTETEAVAQTAIVYQIAADEPETINKRTYEEIIWEKKTADYKLTLESFLKNETPFLKKGYGMENLVTDISITKNILSAFINREYGIGFTEFMNRKRIDHIVTNIEKAEWKNLSIEGIGYEAGFGSKTAFFNAFKKETGITPAQFMKQHIIKSQP